MLAEQFAHRWHAFRHTLPGSADPVFDAGAVPAVLLMGSSKSGLAAGFGSLAVPLMALRTSVPQPAAVMLRWGPAGTLLFGVFGTSFKQLWDDLR